jgi:hypothetical protein
MGRIIIICLAVITMPVVVFTTRAKTQQLTLTEAARAAAAGPEFCPRGPCPGFADIKGLERSVSPKVPKPAGQPKTGPFPPQPYQHARSELPEAAPAQQLGSSGVRVDSAGYSAQLEARADAMFGHGQVVAPERQKWMADQEQRAIENEINRSKALLYPVGGR